MMLKKILRFLLAVLCIGGAGLCVVMLVTALQFSEWGRVFLYSVCMAICIECAVLLLTGIKKKDEE